MSEKTLRYAVRWFDLHSINIITFENPYNIYVVVKGVELKLADEEVKEKAIDFLESEIEGVKND